MSGKGRSQESGVRSQESGGTGIIEEVGVRICPWFFCRCLPKMLTFRA
ncbi:hypothetical protein [Dapis sp. BLCC M229]